MRAIAYLIPAVLIVCCGCRKKSKPLLVLISLYMWVLYAFNTNNGDFQVYYEIYSEVKQGRELWHFEPAFAIIMRLCAGLGLDYIGFKAIIGALQVGLLYKLFVKYSKAPALAMALFLIFPFIYNVSVVRGGLAGLFVCYGFCGYSQGGRNAKAKYLFWVFLGTLFHYSSIVFALYVFVGKIQKPRKVFIGSAVASLVFSAAAFSGLAFRIMSIFTSRIKSLQWLSTALYAHLNATGVILVVFVFVANYWMSGICYKTIAENAVLEDQKYERLARMARAANCAVFVALPFAVLSDVMLRYVFEFMAVNIAVYSTAAAMSTERKSRAGVISVKNILAFLWVMFMFMYVTLPYLGTEISAFNTFYNNLLFGQKIPY